MNDPIQQIKERIDIVELVKEYVVLKQAGSNFKAPCPFHKEKNASFMVSSPKQIWHCFGCGEGGDLFTFFTKIEGVEFKEALQILAQRAGVILERMASREPRDKKERLYDLVELAAGFFTQALVRAPQAQTAREYLKGRDISQMLQDEFSFGYALEDFDRLYQFLISKKYTTPEIVEAGLAMVKEQGRAMDRFRGRIMIPIRDIHGHIVGFGGRILQDQPNAPKYLNSPQTSLYDKSRIVFNLDHARHAIRETNQVIIVEGYMDVIALVQGGVRNVVASCGTALTSEQVKLIKRFTQQFLFCFDADTAGIQATERGIDVALQEGIDARIVQLPQGDNGKPLYKDPDECIRKDPEAWKASIQHAMPFIHFLTQHEILNKVLEDSYRKTQSVHKILSFIGRIPDRVMQDHWVTYLAKEMSVSETILWEELETAKKRSKTPFRSPAAAPTPSVKAPQNTSIDPIEFSFIVSLLQYPADLKSAINMVGSEMIQNKDLSTLYNLLCKDYSDSTSIPSLSSLSVVLSQPGLLEKIEAAAAFEVTEGTTVEELCARIRSRYKERRTRELQHLMSKAEKEQDHEAVKQYMAEFQMIQTM